MSKRRTRAPACVFEGLPVAATLTDARGRILTVNREARRIAGPRAGARTCREYWGCVGAGKSCPLKKAMRTRRTIRHALVHARGSASLVERVSLVRLPGGARGAVIVTGPATSFVRRLKRLKRQAHVDALTGLLNRRHFDELTARATAGERRRSRGAFLMWDVDGLKTVNDRLGHAAGDRQLRRLGRVLAANIRRGDIAGRVGGDEFAVYCPDTSPTQARELARRVKQAIAADNMAHPRWPRLSAQHGLAYARAGVRSYLRAEADARLRERKNLLYGGRGRPGIAGAHSRNRRARGAKKR